MQETILIADSGSTKTDWAMPGLPGPVRTQGINPFHQDRPTILRILREELLPQLPAGVGAVCFYGSGVRPELEPDLADMLRQVFPQADLVEAHSDMLGAARAVCGRCEGIAGILGTGANSCLYDGRRMVANTPALGYILGDEGSGAVLGKRLVNALYKGALPQQVVADFERETQLSMPAVVERVYRQPLANRFLASLSLFVGRHLAVPAVHRLVVDNFADFFRLNIAPYQRADLPVSCVGSIGWHFRAQLRQAAREQGFTLGTVVQSPLEGLLAYHCR